MDGKVIMTDKELFNDLSYKRTNVYEVLTDEQSAEMEKLCDEYRKYLDTGKTERECVKESIELAKSNGFKELAELDTLKPGDKIYTVNRGKNILLAVIGTDSIFEGLNLVGAHIDSPRLDLKQNPLYESNDMALLKTHYYGVIKKYQWTAIPLAIHGVIVKTNGEKITVNIGEYEEDPIFTITDLLPHLAMEQMERKLKEGVKGEDLNLLIGSIPYNDKDVNEKVKLNIMSILNKKYGIVEADFLSSELEIVPAF